MSRCIDTKGQPCLCCVIAVQSLSCVLLFATPWTAALQASLFTISQSLLKLMSKESMIPSNHLILCHHLLLLPSVFPSIRVFSNELAFHIRWPKYWSFSFSISPSNENSGLISFRIDWFDLLAVQGTPAMIFFLIEDSRGLRRTETSHCTMTAFTWPLCLCSATFSISGHWSGPH